MTTDAEKISRLQDLLRDIALDILLVVDEAAFNAVHDARRTRERNAEQEAAKKLEPKALPAHAKPKLPATCDSWVFTNNKRWGCRHPKGHAGAHLHTRFME